jgi:hypothetical protein
MKYAKVKFDVRKIVRLFKAGKNVSQIAQAIGFPKNAGQNRTRAALVKAGVYKKPAQRKAA